VRTGKQYLDSLGDGRAVWFNGERVTDLTSHPILSRTAQAVARLYDLQHDPEHTEAMTFAAADGSRQAMPYFVPRSVEDLGRLRKYYELLTLQTGGFFGRFSAIMTLWHAYSMDPTAVYQKYNPVWLENMQRFRADSMKIDPWLSGAFHGPSGDRSKAVSGQDDPDAYLRIVETRPDGIVINGYKAATLAAFSNEIYVVPWAFLQPEEKDWALSVVVPTATRGVKIVCREQLVDSASAFSYPLSGSFDEIDAHVIFDHVFVPNARIFCAGEPQVLEEVHLKARIGGRLAPGTIPYVAWFSTLQSMVRVKLMLGSAYLIAQASGAMKTQSAPVVDGFAEIIQIYQQLKALVIAAESDPIYTQSGMAVPRPSIVYAGRHFVLDAYYRALCRFHELVGGTPVIAPQEGDFDNREIAPYLEKYLRGVEVDGRRRLQLVRFARELGMGYGAGRVQIFNHHGDAPRDSFKKQTMVYFEDLGEAQECIDSVERLLSRDSGAERSQP
jgi:aromatic ring hydroxylase